MKQLFRYDFNEPVGFFPRYSGVFFNADPLCGFAYYRSKDLFEALFFEKDGSIIDRKSIKLPGLVLPESWKTVCEGDKQFLLCPAYKYTAIGATLAPLEYPRKVYAFLITGKSIVEVDGERFLRTSCLNRDHFYSDSFQFDDYVIKHISQFKYSCVKKDDGEKIWDLTVRGYLYSDIIRLNDTIIINTAGMGGYVYGVNLITGDVVYKIKTGDTYGLAINRDRLYITVAGKKGLLLDVDAHSGEILETETLSVINSYSSLGLIDDKVLVVTYSTDSNSNAIPSIICFDCKSIE